MTRRSERIQRARQARQRRQTFLIVAAVVVVVAVVAFAVWPRAETVNILTAEDLPRISVNEAARLVNAGDAQLYDVRPVAAYRDLHAAGALSLPESEAVDLISSLPQDQLLILY